MVSQKLLAANPKAVAGLVRAVNKAMIAIAKDQNAGMKAAMNYDNLINDEVEKRRLQYSFDKLIVSPEMKEIGVGDIKDDRMARAIGIVVEGYQLARAPTPAEIFSREFLPPRAERELIYISELNGMTAGMATDVTRSQPVLRSRPRHARQRRARHDGGVITSIVRQRRRRPGLAPSSCQPSSTPTIMRGRRASSFGAVNMPLESWILRSALGTPADPYLAAASALARSARAGCAAMMVHYTRPSGTMPLVDEAKQIARAASDVGIRIAFALAVRDQNPIVYGDSEPVLSSTARRRPQDHRGVVRPRADVAKGVY